MTITSKINKLQEKRTWIRNSYRRFLEEWAEHTKGKDVKIKAPILKVDSGYETDYTVYYLVCGEKELHYINYYGDEHEYSENSWSWDSLSIAKIKEIISNLPDAIKKIENTIDKKIKEENNITFPKY